MLQPGLSCNPGGQKAGDMGTRGGNAGSPRPAPARPALVVGRLIISEPSQRTIIWASKSCCLFPQGEPPLFVTLGRSGFLSFFFSFLRKSAVSLLGSIGIGQTLRARVWELSCLSLSCFRSGVFLGPGTELGPAWRKGRKVAVIDWTV